MYFYISEKMDKISYKNALLRAFLYAQKIPEYRVVSTYKKKVQTRASVSC